MDDLDTLIEIMVKEGASDLHLATNRLPFIRVSGNLVPLTKHPKMTKIGMEEILNKMLSGSKKEAFKIKQSVDFAYSYKVDRFRTHLFLEQQNICLALRHIPSKIPTLAELNLPESLADFARMKSGFFLVVGPCGQGKSTTLASLVDLINKERLENIITIEDPIEYLFKEDKSIIHQREVEMDTPDFGVALED
jgi:twitching motility protein PilT